jgi:hypothetical protein
LSVLRHCQAEATGQNAGKKPKKLADLGHASARLP